MPRRDLIREPMELQPHTVEWTFNGVNYKASAFPFILAKFINVGRVISLNLNHLRLVYQNQLNTSHANGNLYTLLSRADLVHSYVCFAIHANDVMVRSEILAFIQYIKENELQPLQGIFNQETMAFERTEVRNKDSLQFHSHDGEDALVEHDFDLYAGPHIYDLIQRDSTVSSSMTSAEYRTDPSLSSSLYLVTKNQKDDYHELDDDVGGSESSHPAFSTNSPGGASTNSSRPSKLKSSRGARDSTFSKPSSSGGTRSTLDMNIVRIHSKDLISLYQVRRSVGSGARFCWDKDKLNWLVCSILSCVEPNATQKIVIDHVVNSLKKGDEYADQLEKATGTIRSKVRGLWNMMCTGMVKLISFA